MRLCTGLIVALLVASSALAQQGGVEEPWWRCSCTADCPLTPLRTPDQQRRLEDFGRDRFIPAPGPDRADRTFPPSELIARFGPPLRTRSEKIREVPQDPDDKSLLVVTTWEYRGFRIVTQAAESEPDLLWMESGEAFDEKLSLGHGVGLGQPIEQWERQFGRPNCGPAHSVVYKWDVCPTEDDCSLDFQVLLRLDTSGKVEHMEWSGPADR